MHRTLCMSRTAIWLVVFSTAWVGLAAAQPAPEPVPPPRREGAPLRGNQVIIPLGSSQHLQMKQKKVIRRVINPKDSVALVQPLQDDPTTVLITGREAGITRITLTAQDGTEETYEIIVQFDVEFLRTLLLRAVPTANLELIPAASGVIIIAGTVAHAEDIDIIMRTAQSVVTAADHVVNAMRVGGVQQVQLDVCVAFVSRTKLRSMSFDFLNAGMHHNFSSTVGGALQNPALGSSLTSIPGINLPVANAIGAPNGEPANFFLGLFNDKQVFYGLLQALKTENLAKILSEPRVVTLSGRSATLLSGGQQAIPEAAGLGTVSVRFEPFGTQLTVLPIVLGNGKIHLEVEPEVSNIDASVGTTIAGTSVPGRNTQRVHTTVEMEDGQTLAIGGLIQNQIQATTTRVPVLGDLPFLGAAFRSESFTEQESELVVLVTPHLVDAMSCDQVPKVVPGQETRSPDDFELFLEGILEAPRGPRDICQDHRYVPAFKNSPTADQFPCAGGRGGCGAAGCGAAGCGGTGSPDAAPASEAVRDGVRAPVSSAPAETASGATAAKDGKPALPPATTGSAAGLDGAR
jgi:pilus assembly protein CpaC